MNNEIIYTALNNILPGKVSYGYILQETELPAITYKLDNGSRDYDTGNAYDKGNAIIFVVAKTLGEIESLTDSIKGLDWTKLNSPTLVKFKLNLITAPVEELGKYFRTIVFDYWSE